MAVRFDAATDRLSYSGSNPPDPTSGFTLTCWAYVAVDTDTNATIARIHAAAGASSTVVFATGADGLGGPNYFTGGGSVSATTNMAVGAWRKVAVACTGTTGRVYAAIPGGSTEAVSGTVSGTATPTGITVGGRSAGDGSEWFNGRVAYVRVWSSELSQGQIEAEWASTTPVVTANLWADWPLSVHTDLTDHSGNGRDLVAGSTATTTESGPPINSTISGTAAGALGALAGTVTGVPTVLGVAGKNLGGLAGTASGTPAVLGVAAGSLGALAGAATGSRTPINVAGTALGALGALAGLAVQRQASAASGSSWYGLLSILDEERALATQERARPPVACPNDGEPLQSGRRGVLFCRFDGYQWPRDR